MSLRALEFFSGIGGLHAALKQVKPDSTIVSSFDINPNAYKVYHHNYPDVPYIQKDITGITSNANDIERYGADVWLLSPPCQPHTRQGMKKDCGDSRSDGLLHIIELLKAVDCIPSYLLLENVEGFEASQSREKLLLALKERGYFYQEFILSPNQFQIPNQRDRYFLIARRREFPPPPEDTPRIGPCFRMIPFHPTCTNIIYKNGTAEMGTKESHELWNSLNSKCRPLRDFLDNPIVLGNDLTPHLVKQSILQKSGNHLDIVTPDDRYSCCFTKAYRKYHTGTGSLLQTATPYQMPPVARDLENLKSLKLRYFTGTEMKRLHGFPEDFGFPDDLPETQRAKLSLSVTVVAALLEYLLK
ncbi:hypothetical protein WA588_001697 [Blastocystis sp. NMH]